MTWDLDISSYNSDEIHELFGLTRNTNEDSKCQALSSAFQKVALDSKKTETEKASFHAFLLDAGQMIGVPKSTLHTVLMKRGLLEVRQDAFMKPNDMEEVGDHMLITHPREIEAYTDKKDGRETTEARNPPGIINPIKVHTLNKAINIDSRFRDNYYNSQSGSFSVTLPTRILNCVQMRIGNLAIPLTFYTFTRKLGNTTFVVTLNETDRFVVTLPDGNYNTPFRNISGAQMIEDAMNQALRDAGVDPLTKLCYRIDRATGKSAFAVPDPNGTGVTNFTIQFNCDSDGNIIPDDNVQLRLGWILGFRVGTYIGGPSASATGAAVVSEGICFTKGPRYIFLAVDEFTNSVNDYFYSAFQSSLLPNNILTRIDIGTLRDGYGFFQLADGESFTTQVNTSRSYFGPITIEKLKLTLYDEYGRILDLNNMDWSIALSFDCLYH
jgi:hypothetical protein